MVLHTTSAGSMSPSERAKDITTPPHGGHVYLGRRQSAPPIPPPATPEDPPSLHVPIHTVELVPEGGSTRAYHFHDGVLADDAGHSVYSFHLSDSSTLNSPQKLDEVLGSLGALCNDLEEPELTAYDRALLKQNEELAKAVEEEKKRLRALREIKEKRCVANMQKMRGIVTEVSRSVRFKDAISAEMKRKLELGSPKERIEETAQTILANETLRSTANPSELVIPLKKLRDRDPDIMQYTVMRSLLSRGRNRFDQEPTEGDSEREVCSSPTAVSAPGSPSSAYSKEWFPEKSEEKEEEDLTPVSSEQELSRIMDEVFMFIDVNNDGDIQFQEVKSFTDTLPSPPSNNKLQTMFRVADIDGSGSIEKGEFLVLLRQLEGSLKMSAQQMVKHFRLHCMGKLFDMLDADGDKALSINEIAGLVRTLQMDCTQVYDLRKLNIKMNYSQEDIRTMFREVDADDSGELDRDEFVTFISRLASDVPVSHLMNAFLKGKQLAQDRMKLKKMMWNS